MQNPLLRVTLPKGWVEKKLTPFFKKSNMDTVDGRNKIVFMALDNFMDTHPNSLTITENELTALARKATERFTP